MLQPAALLLYKTAHQTSRAATFDGASSVAGWVPYAGDIDFQNAGFAQPEQFSCSLIYTIILQYIIDPQSITFLLLVRINSVNRW